MNSFTFFRNWWELAENRDTDEKRLAFYDTIFRLAFEGKTPERPVKGVSHGIEYAAWDAYQSVWPVLSESIRKAENGRGKAVREADAKKAAKQDASKPRSKDGECAESASRSLLKIREEKIIEDTPTGCRGGGGLPDLKTFLSACEIMGVPRDFAATVHGDLSAFAGEDGHGEKIGSWRRYVKAAWRKEQARAQQHDSVSDGERARISEDDL